MLDKMMTIRTVLHSVGFFPEVAIFLFCAYFMIVKVLTDWVTTHAKAKKLGGIIALIFSFIGQFAFNSPRNWTDPWTGVGMMVVMGVIQLWAAIGFYSWAEKYDFIGRMGDWLNSKMPGGAR